MSVITLPDNNFRSINWTLVQPTQVNRSEFTSARQVMQLPGASYWKVSADHVPIRGEANIRSWRSFLAKLRGQTNTFRLPAVEGAQHSSSNPFAGPGGATTLVSIANVATTADSITRFIGGGAWDASGVSTIPFGTGAALTFSPPATGDWHMGINTNANANTSTGYSDIPFCFHGSAGTLFIRENSVVVATIGTYSAGEQLGIYYSGSQVIYYRSNAVVRTVTAPASQSYRVDSSIFTASLSIQRITFGLAVSGITAITVVGLTPSTTVIREGMLATVRLIDGSEQLVQVTVNCTADSKGHGVLEFQPTLRKPAMPGATVETVSPWAVVAMDSPELGWSVDPGALYGLSFTATEAL